MLWKIPVQCKTLMQCETFLLLFYALWWDVYGSMIQVLSKLIKRREYQQVHTEKMQNPAAFLWGLSFMQFFQVQQLFPVQHCS